MKMQLLQILVDPKGQYDLPTGGRTVCYVTEHIDSDMVGEGVRIWAMVEIQADMVKKEEKDEDRR